MPKGGAKAKKAEEAARKAEEERLGGIAEQERQERERQEMEEEERRLAEEKRQWLEVESKRLSEEKLEVEPMLTQRSKVLLQEEKKRLDLEEWQAFIDCTHLPDVRKESELSTYIALWEEEHEVDLEKTMQDTQLALDVIRGLESLVSKALVVGDEASVEKNRMYMLKIKMIIEEKIDRASAWMLEHVDQNIATDNTCQCEFFTPLQKVGIWVNIAKNLRLKNIEYSSLGVVTDVPRPIILSTCALRLVHFRKDIRSHVATGDYFTIGGVLIMEVLDVPERPRQVKAHLPDVKEGGYWHMKRISDTAGSVSRQEYPARDPNTGILAKVPPIQIRFTIPSDVLLTEGTLPRLGWWNKEKRDNLGDWDEEGFSEISLENKDGQKILNFTSNRITALAILQSRWACFPYQGWIMQPMGPNLAMLTVHLNGNLIVKIEIGSGRCRLLSPSDDALRDLRDKPRPAMNLLQDLIFHGLNLLPVDADAAHLSSDRIDFPALLKTKTLEERACLGISMLAPAFAICSSKVNGTLGSTEATVRVAPITDMQAPPLTEDDTLFRTVLFREGELHYCLLLDPAAESATHSDSGQILDRDGNNRAPPNVGPETKFLPLNLMREVSEDTPIARCEESSPSFTESIRVMLQTMRLLSFMAPTLPPEQEKESAEDGGEQEAQPGGAEEAAGEAAPAVEAPAPAPEKPPATAGSEKPPRTASGEPSREASTAGDAAEAPVPPTSAGPPPDTAGSAARTGSAAPAGDPPSSAGAPEAEAPAEEPPAE
mmetsp:Transcript_24971/g.59572  ORF Transcript_24971/g.59572 Transcript_24971/m.59572 type:complete len:770 (+) Transcript_24971:119-2428(+)